MSMLHDFMKKDKMEDVTVFIDKLRRINCIVSKHLVRKPIKILSCKKHVCEYIIETIIQISSR